MVDLKEGRTDVAMKSKEDGYKELYRKAERVDFKEDETVLVLVGRAPLRFYKRGGRYFYKNDDKQGSERRIDGNELTLSRSNVADLLGMDKTSPLVGDISTEHATLRFDGQGFMLVDHSSSKTSYKIERTLQAGESATSVHPGTILLKLRNSNITEPHAFRIIIRRTGPDTWAVEDMVKHSMVLDKEETVMLGRNHNTDTFPQFDISLVSGVMVAISNNNGEITVTAGTGSAKPAVTVSWVNSDRAMMNIADSVNPTGGIDMNSANLDLRIKRDGKGVPLPLLLQDMEKLQSIDGFVPVIINITPVTALPILSELKESREQVSMI